MGVRDNDRRLRPDFEHAFRFSALLKPNGEVLEIERQALAFWGLSERDVKGRRFWDIGWRLVQDDQEQRLKSAVQAAAQGRAVRREAAVWTSAEQKVALSFSLRPLIDEQGEIIVLIADARNLTRRSQVEAALERIVAGERTQQASGAVRAQAALQWVEVAVFVSDDEGIIEYLNPAAANLLGQAADAALGRPLTAVLAELGPETVALREHVLRSHGAAVPGEQEYRFQLEAATRLLGIRALYSPIETGGGFVLVLRVEAEEPHPALLGRDALTGLLNRGGLLAQLSRALQEDCGAGRHHTLCYLDLDGFEQINVSLGPQAADEALRQVAVELRGHARHGDVVARLGGDDFALLLRDCALNDARMVTEAMLSGIHQLRPTARGKPPQFSASAGLVELAGGLEPRTVLRAAKQACLHAKEAGGNQLVATTAMAAQDAEGTARTVQQLFEQHRVRLFAQPLVALDGHGSRAHAEVLLRLEGDDGSLQPPKEILGRAEQSDLMTAIDRWVIRKVFAHCARKDTFGPHRIADGFSINLSHASLADDGLISFIKGQRNEFGLDPQRISFEIGEPAALADVVRTRAIIEALHEAGFQVTLDDCGNGGHPLNYLRELPVDYIKIGASLVRTLVDDPVDNVLVDSINRIGHLTGKRTVGKCVENDATVKRLRALQVDFAQGFGLAEPMAMGRGAS
jgi:diguanylate cyclase (GGDEF)-like protein/PAS domain S-box-containing protein